MILPGTKIEQVCREGRHTITCAYCCTRSTTNIKLHAKAARGTEEEMGVLILLMLCGPVLWAYDVTQQMEGQAVSLQGSFPKSCESTLYLCFVRYFTDLETLEEG